MAALAACAVTAAQLRDRTDTQASPPARAGQPPPADLGMIPLTVPEITRLLATSPASRPPGHAEAWTNWRRRHQAAPAGTTSAPASPAMRRLPRSVSQWRLPY